MTGFRVRHGEDAYPIGRLIADRARTLGIGRSELLHRCGYSNLNKGHRALSMILLTGQLTPFVARHLASALQVEPTIIDEAIAETAAQHEAEATAQWQAAERRYYESFRPYLRAETERRIPQPIHIAALFRTVEQRLVPLPDEVWHAGVATRDHMVKAAIFGHHRQQQGRVPAFGKIVGYALILAPGVHCDLALTYDIEGNRAGPMRAVHRVGSVTLTVRGKTVPGSLVKHYGAHNRETKSEVS